MRGWWSCRPVLLTMAIREAEAVCKAPLCSHSVMGHLQKDASKQWPNVVHAGQSLVADTIANQRGRRHRARPCLHWGRYPGSFFVFSREKVKGLSRGERQNLLVPSFLTAVTWHMHFNV